MPSDPHVHHVAAEAAQQGGFFQNLFETFTPRRVCMNLEADVIWLHVISDFLIAAAYYSIPIALVYFVRRRRDLQFNWMFLMFAAFILACGTTHLFGVWAIWQPLYRLDGLVKAGTALVSISTAILLWPLIPKALAIPSAAEMFHANAELEREINQRRTAQEALCTANEQLEVRVVERTAELEAKNQALQVEIHERQRAEDERNQLLASERSARNDAQNANRVKDEFLATLSHELRTPLNAILGWSQLLSKPKVDADILRQGLETIERSVRVQTQLIEDLLDMSRITSGKMRLHIQQIHLPKIIDAALDTVHPAAEAKNLRLHRELDPTVDVISGDANRLQQVVWNLLSNAIKFTPAGGDVHISAQRRDSEVMLSVSDSGIGIREEFMPYVFERFRQADSSSTRRFGGLGLGLAIVKHLVELHGGTISVSSEGPGKGATFTVVLPLKTVPAPGGWGISARPEVAADRTDYAPPSLEGRRILVIDDEADSRDLIARILRDSLAEVELASSAPEGLKLHQTFKPDLLVCDIGMPDWDGYDFIRAIRALPEDRGGNIPAVAFTALARTEDQLRALSSGFQTHLAKPVEPLVLVAVLAGLVQGTRRHEPGESDLLDKG